MGAREHRQVQRWISKVDAVRARGRQESRASWLDKHGSICTRVGGAGTKGYRLARRWCPALRLVVEEALHEFVLDLGGGCLLHG
eukprot:6197408-Pleurochrysis_carterae.AAC.2